MKKVITLLAFAFMFINSIQSFSQVTKMPLLEEFTSSTCGPCAANNPTLDAMLDSHEGSYVCVKYQMNWPGSGDIYYNSDGSTRRGSYAVSGIPELVVDGSVWPSQPAGFVASDLSNECSVQSNVIIEAHYTLIDSILTVYGNIYPQTNITGNIRKHIAVVERHTYDNASSNGETEFSYVEHKMLPNGSGVYSNGMTGGATIPFTQSISLGLIPDIEDISNLMFAVWVQSSTTKEVLQSAWATLPTGVQEISPSSNGIVNLYPNPATNQTTIQYQLQDNDAVSLKILNSFGQTIKETVFGKTGFGTHQEIIDTHNFASGIYFIDLQIGNNHYRQPLMVQ